MSTRAEDITRTLGGDWHGDYGNVPTPGHSKSDRGTTVRQGSDPDDVVVNNFNGGDPVEIKMRWREQGLLPPLQNGRTSQNKSYASKPKPSAVPNGSEKKPKDSNSDYALKICEAAGPIEGTLGEKYFEGRGLVPPWPKDLRFFPKLWNKEKGGDLPALVVAVRPSPDAPIQAIQRIFLDADGQKADLAKPKMALGDLKGGGFWVPGDGGTFLVTEGPEDAMSVNIATRLPTVSAISGPNMENLKFPPGTLRVIICADHGEGGRKFALAAGEVFANAGLGVVVAVTATSSKDWNEVLQDERGGARAIKETIQAAIPLPKFMDDAPIFSTGIKYTKASAVPMERINWNWKDYLARKKITVFAGMPASGKSQCMMNFTAIVTTGGHWPDGTKFPEPANVIILSGEDDVADTMVPRAKAAGADLDRVYFIEAVRNIDADGNQSTRSFNLKEDIANTEKMIEEISNVAFLFIDPISAYWGDTDSYRNAEVRATLEPWSKIAEKHNLAIVAITHFSKAEAKRAMNRVLDSIGMIAAARAGFAFLEDKDDPSQRLFLPMKNNIGPDRCGWRYRIEVVTVDEEKGIEAPRIVWGDAVELTADEVLDAETGEEVSALDQAKDVLQQILKSGPVPATNVFSEAKEAGVAEKTLNRASIAMGVKKVRHGFGQGALWKWELPAPEDGQDPEDGQANGKGTFEDTPSIPLTIFDEKQPPKGQKTAEISRSYEDGQASGEDGHLRGHLRDDGHLPKMAKKNTPYWRAKQGGQA